MKKKLVLLAVILLACVLIAVAVLSAMKGKAPERVMPAEPQKPTAAPAAQPLRVPAMAVPAKPRPAAPVPVKPQAVAPRPLPAAPQPVVEIEPKTAKDFYDRGVRFYYRGKYDEAIADFDKAVQLDANYAEAYCELAVATMEKGDFTAAIGYLEKSIKIKPEYPKSNYALAVCYSRISPPDTVNARKYLDKAKETGYLVPPWFEDFVKRQEEQKKVQ